MAGSRGRKIAIAVVALLLVVLAFAAYESADVLESGHILPYTKARAERVEVLGGPKLTVQVEPPSRVDSLTTACFFGLAAVALLMSLMLRGIEGRQRERWFWAAIVVGSVYLGLDELLGVHESIGANMRFLADIPGVHTPEDVVISLYAIPGLIFLYLFWDLLRASRLGLRLLIAGFALYVFSAALDVLDTLMDEQLVELASIVVLFSGFLVIAMRELRLLGGRLGRREEPAPAAFAEPSPVAAAARRG